MKRVTMLLWAMVIGVMCTALHAQTIRGNVSDDSGEPLIGASVLVKGTSTGTVSDVDGNFSLTVPEGGEALIISYTGFNSQEVALVPGTTAYDISLSEGVTMSDVVVTAIGIERRRDEDLSSATLIETDVLQRSGETGVIQGLAGKTSGVTITRNTGDPGAGAYIQIRGQNTILGDASPLIILDGVPISNSSVGNSTAGVVQQSRLNDINPDDIESITVLKGASAAAVYGTGAANGVLVIKTKRGRTAGRRFTVNGGITYGIDEVNVEYDKQDAFGQGFPNTFNGSPYSDFGYYVNNTSLSWGDRIADRSGTDVVDQTGGFFTGDQTGAVYYPITDKQNTETFNESNREQVFQTGQMLDVNFGVNFRGENSNTYFSFSHLDQEGVMRGNSDYTRNT
ncbi:MAG: TonB-dependent receptor plug domain-containing protein, partial [Bacteroidota bacterium]